MDHFAMGKILDAMADSTNDEIIGYALSEFRLKLLRYARNIGPRPELKECLCPRLDGIRAYAKRNDYRVGVSKDIIDDARALVGLGKVNI